jgi:uncharacterized protein YrrD
MLLTINDLSDYTIQATDGEIGNVEELYFHQEGWRVRYLVVNLGNWLTRQQVLLVPDVVTRIDTENEQVVVNLTRQQVEDSPDILTDMPVSREKEALLHQHFQWQPYWTGHPTESMTFGSNAIVQDLPGQSITSRLPQNDAGAVTEMDEGFRYTLRSSNAVSGYYIEALDDEIGHVDDFIVDTNTWQIRYLIIDTRNWLPGRQVLVGTDWVQQIRWQESLVKVALAKEKIENSPEYESGGLISAELEEKLAEYYERVIA